LRRKDKSEVQGVRHTAQGEFLGLYFRGPRTLSLEPSSRLIPQDSRVLHLELFTVPRA